MTKQQKLDWIIRDFMRTAFVCEDDNYRAEMSIKLRQLLKSQGVVIKKNKDDSFGMVAYEEII